MTLIKLFNFIKILVIPTPPSHTKFAKATKPNTKVVEYLEDQLELRPKLLKLKDFL